MDTLAFGAIKDCRRLTNGTVELVITASVGPRVVRYGFPGGQNLLGEYPDEVVPTPMGPLHLLGGHRLWAAPELMEITYAPDDAPVKVKEEGPLAAVFTQSVDQAGLEKEIRVALDAKGTGVTLRHRITNRRKAAIEIAPWALSVMRDGTAIIPAEPYKSHDEYFLPARPFVLWHYTDLADPRFTFGKKYVRMTALAPVTEPTKIGFGNRQGWVAFAARGELFVKTFPWKDGAAYLDMGCNCEFYTVKKFLEVESLGPLAKVAPGESVEHTERWGLWRNVDTTGDDAALDRALAPVKAFVGGGSAG